MRQRSIGSEKRLLVVRRDLVARKVGRAAAWLEEVEATLSRPRYELAKDVKSRDLAAFYLFLAIQECIDLAAHWVADEKIPPPQDAASTFDTLASRDLITVESAELMRAATGLRNRIGHGYAELDEERLHEEANEGVAGIREFLVAVAEAAGL